MNSILIENIAVQASVEAAKKCYKWIGVGKSNEADEAAVLAMQKVLNEQHIITGKVVIGEGERDNAPMLYIGQILGTGSIECDIAVDPLEGTNLCAQNMPNSMTTIAIGEKGSLLNAPDLYMEKIAIGIAEKGIVDLSFSMKKNIQNLGMALDKKIEDINVLMLDRPRHKEKIDEIRSMGARVSLISDGDIHGVMSVLNGDIDMYYGIGGAPEGVLAACALKVVGGFMQGMLITKTAEDISRLNKMGGSSDRVYDINDMVKGNVVLAMTAVTKHDILEKIFISEEMVCTNTLVLNSYNKTKKNILTEYIL